MPRDSRLYMTFPIDFHRHPKLARLSVGARWAFVEMNGEARIAENDGRFSAEDAEFHWGAGVLSELIASHPSRPLVTRDGDEYVIREYAQHQFTKADREALTEKRAKAGRASADARRTRAQQVLNEDQHPPTGEGIGTGKPSSNEEGAPPPRFCSKHMPNGTEDACRACGNARRRREDWDAAEKNKPSPVIRRDRECPKHPGWIDTDRDPCEKCRREAAEEGTTQ